MGNIVVIEDSEAVRQTVRAALEEVGHNVVEAGDGEEGARHLSEGRFDLAIVDIWMPGLDGISLLKQVRREHPEFPVIIISGGGPRAPLEESKTLAEVHGADAVLIKPFEDDALTQIVERLLKKRN